MLPSELAGKPHIQAAENDKEKTEVGGVRDGFACVAIPARDAHPAMPILHGAEEGSRFGLRRLTGLNRLALIDNLCGVGIHVQGPGAPHGNLHRLTRARADRDRRWRTRPLFLDLG